ncbi:thermonuclease family protein [Priestia aryabhattai]|uniref:thermonuclease family protein n=1 Tax=Priestia aryabhattai TaxID=412384 RepID=UPI0015F678E3|nr:thermonuclease family protein [Priestia aryabhattai]
MTNLQISDNYIRKGKVVKVVDGDTYKILIDGGYDAFFMKTIRLKGINTSDKTLKTKLSKEMAQKATDYATEKLLNKEVYVESYKFEDGGFGRYLAIVYYQDGENWLSFNKELLDVGLAKVYFKGASKVEWEDQ